MGRNKIVPKMGTLVSKGLISHDNCTTGNSLTYEYFCNNYKLIAINFSKQNSEFKNQQINFTGRLEQDATTSFIIE